MSNGPSGPPMALGTVRIGQLTGTTSGSWPDLVDAQRWPLLTDSGRWGMWGVDLGANTEHFDGRLYFFFGDTAEKPPVPTNADLVAWTDDAEILRHGGHQRLGWTFFLPSREQQHATEPAVGQGDWRFCANCHALFFAPRGSADGSVCPNGGPHVPLGWTFFLPSREEQHATEPAVGQGDWRFCANCHGLFFAPRGSADGSVCPKGGPHVPLGWTFFLPSREEQHATEPAVGQADWRFCANCHGLFFDGFAGKGICPGAPGGGIRLQAVLGADGNLDPFRAAEPFGVTVGNETPTGAFSFDGAAYVFAGIAPRRFSRKKRPANPTYGNYLHSKAHPDVAGEFHTEFLFSPRIGWCPIDASRSAFESHRVVGLRFVILGTGPAGPGWRACRRCDTMFWDAPNFPSVCHRGGPHVAKDRTFVFPAVAGDDGQHQDHWCRCARCASLFFNGFGEKGLCPAGGGHVADGMQVSVGHASFDEDVDQMDLWRFCHKCGGLVRLDFSVGNHCPAGGAHDPMGFEFVLPHDFDIDDPGTHHAHPVEDQHHQRLWRCCGKCGAIFWAAAQATSRCPADGGQHAGSTDPQSSQEFFLAHDLPADATHQDRWQVCTRCAGMFFNGFDDFKGVCPAGGVHNAAGFNFVLPHNPGADASTEDGWRFCGRCFAMVDTKHADLFSAAAGWVVRNADHPNHLPQGVSEWGVVLLGFAWGAPCTSRIAWIPLHPGQPPRLTDTRYYSGDPRNWSEHPDDAVTILEHDDFTSVSIAWLDGPRRWICLYSKAIPHKRPDGPAVVRLGTSPWDWSDEVRIFDPVKPDAPPAQKPYGVYMHKQGKDSFATDIPPPEPPNDPHDGWAYGVYLLNRFTTWDEERRELTISYLLSLSSPYQPQLMQTQLQLPD